MKKIFLLGLVSLFLVSCVTINPEKIQSWSDERIQRRLKHSVHSDSVYKKWYRPFREELVKRHPEWPEKIKNQICLKEKSIKTRIETLQIILQSKMKLNV